LICFSQKAINDAFNIASKAKFEKEKIMEDKLDMKQFRLFLRVLRMTYNFYQVSLLPLLRTPNICNIYVASILQHN
jgi:hypothetical protein